MKELTYYVFFFNDTATTEIYTLSLHDALPISADGVRQDPKRPGPAPRPGRVRKRDVPLRAHAAPRARRPQLPQDRKSTRLNSSHANISYAVFCLKKKMKTIYSLHTMHSI